MVALVLDGLVGFPAGLSPTSFHLSPSSFHLSPRLGLGDCGRGCVWSGSRLACLPLPFICLPLLFIVSQAGCLWSGSRPACLPLPFICLPLLFICLPGWVLVVGFPAGLSPTSFHLSPRLGACGRVPGRLVSHFLSFVSHFLSGWVLVVGFPAGLSPTSFRLSPTSFHLSPSWVLVVGFPAGLSPTSFHVSPTFSPSSLLLGVLNSFLRRVRPLCHCWCPPISTGHVAFLFICLPGLLLLLQSTTQIRRLVWQSSCRKDFGKPFCHCCLCLLPGVLDLVSLSVLTTAEPFSADHAAFLFMCLPNVSLVVSALFRWPCSISIHLSPRSVTAGVRPFLLAM